MPQMSSIGWLSLFIIFSLAFFLFNVMNYYSTLPLSPKSIKLNQLKMNSLNWKW